MCRTTSTRQVLLRIALAVALTADVVSGSDVPGVWISPVDGFSTSSAIIIRSPQASGTVVDIAPDVATGGIVIAVNGLSGEASAASVSSLSYIGSAEGGDQVHDTYAALPLSAEQFGENNTLTIAGGASCTARLFGDYDTVVAIGGTAALSVCGGAHNTYSGNWSYAAATEALTPTSLANVFLNESGTAPQVYIISTQGSGTSCSVVGGVDSTQITVNGISVQVPPPILVTYIGSYGGNDSVTIDNALYSDGDITLWGSGNSCSINSNGVTTLLVEGSDNTLSDTIESLVSDTIFGSNETITGSFLAAGGSATAPVPLLATAATPGPPGAGSGTGSGGATNGSSTSHGCGLGSLALLLLVAVVCKPMRFSRSSRWCFSW